jgi:hypothetical protein
MSKPPDEEEDQIFSGKALGDDGALRPAKPIPLVNEIPTLHPDSLIHDPAYEPTIISIPPRAAVPPALAQSRPPVELADRPPPPMESDFQPPPPAPSVPLAVPWGRWLFRVLVLAACVGGIAGLASGKLSLPTVFPFTLLHSSGGASDKPKEARVGTPAPTLLVLSDPAGATVLVNGTEVGVTPWAGDNVWPKKEPVRVEVRKAGYKTWSGVTMGGQQATLEANLHRR